MLMGMLDFDRTLTSIHIHAEPAYELVNLTGKPINATSWQKVQAAFKNADLVPAFA